MVYGGTGAYNVSFYVRAPKMHTIICTCTAVPPYSEQFCDKPRQFIEANFITPSIWSNATPALSNLRALRSCSLRVIQNSNLIFTTCSSNLTT